MEARQVPAGEGRLQSEATGEIERDGKVLVIKRIHVRYRLRVQADHREVAERAHAIHADHCPVARSLKGAIAVTTELTIEPA
ncbi:MAG: OsmC family protein [Candidatus Methylomirabilales bacterium]